MTRERPRGLLARFRHLVKGMFAVWIRDGERQNPAAVYEQAIHERARQYRELKEAVAGILYMRNKLEGEIHERRVDIARLHDDTRRAIRRGQDELSLSLIESKQVLMEELERAERELEGLRAEAEEAKANLVRFRDEIRTLTREKGRMLATLANATARRRLTETLDGLSVDADMKALEAVRDHIARVATEGQLDRELGGNDEVTRRRLRAIRDDVRHEAARRELEELKQSLQPREINEPATPVPAPGVKEREVPVFAG
jgi:phage shock protein A